MNGGAPPRLLENSHGGGEDAVCANEGQAVRCVSRTSGGGAADSIARAAWEVHTDDAVQRPARRVARRIGWAKYRDDWRRDRRCEVHRARIPRNQNIEAFEECRQGEQIKVPGHVDQV
jgi:hypothetical protein